MISNLNFNGQIWREIFSKSRSELLCLTYFSLRNSKNSLDDKNSMVDWYVNHPIVRIAWKKIETNQNKAIMSVEYFKWDADFQPEFGRKSASQLKYSIDMIPLFEFVSNFFYALLAMWLLTYQSTMLFLSSSDFLEFLKDKYVSHDNSDRLFEKISLQIWPSKLSFDIMTTSYP